MHTIEVEITQIFDLPPFVVVAMGKNGNRRGLCRPCDVGGNSCKVWWRTVVKTDNAPRPGVDHSHQGREHY